MMFHQKQINPSGAVSPALLGTLIDPGLDPGQGPPLSTPRSQSHDESISSHPVFMQPSLNDTGKLGLPDLERR